MAAFAERGVLAAVAVTALLPLGCTHGELQSRDAGVGVVVVVTPDGGIDWPGERISDDDWKAMIAPRTGEHAVDDRDSNLCQPIAIAQDYLVQPSIDCTLDPAYPTPTYECVVGQYCTRHDQCQEHPYGSCRGTPSSLCAYPGTGRKVCTTDAECAAVPGGSCYPYAQTATECFPTGECVLSGQRLCSYTPQSCAADADCTRAPGGRCAKRIYFSRCEYQECMTDADCQAGTRCMCRATINTCIPADCRADSDCGAGHQCLLLTNCITGSSYHCTSDRDTCHAHADCAAGKLCMFSDSAWQCAPSSCPDVP